MVTATLAATVVPVDTTASRAPGALTRLAPVLFVLSIAARLAWTYLVPNGANFVDLHVYVGGAGALDHPGTLYDYVYADQTPDFPLPFTYPPFAAVLFYPLHLLPFGVVAFCWQIGIVAALYGVVWLSLRLLGRADARMAMLWTAVGIWTEPLRSTFDYGQVNVLLVLAVLYAVFSSRWWLSGLLVGRSKSVGACRRQGASLAYALRQAKGIWSRLTGIGSGRSVCERKDWASVTPAVRRPVLF